MDKASYKQTVIGLIPEDWAVNKLKNIAPLQRGFDLPTSQLRDGPYPVVYSNGIGAFHNKAMCDAPGLITGRSGTIGKFTFIAEGKYWPHNTTLWVTSFHNNNPLFIRYLYSTLSFEDYSTGSGVPTLNRNDVHEHMVAVPYSLAEQQRIAKTLFDVDEMLGSLERLIEKKCNIKRGTMQELLTAKKRLPGFSGEWLEKELGCILDYEQPQRYIVKSSEYGTAGIPVLTPGKSFILGYTTENSGIYDKGDVILFDDFLAISRYVSFPFKVKSSAVKLLTLKDENCDLRYIFNLMQIIPFDASDHKRYWIGQYSKILVKIPPTLAEQRAIARVLSDMDGEIAALEAKLEKYKNIKRGMMQDLLTGRVRI